jgi:predicted transcriptional regulator
MSIKPKYVSKISIGEKTAEFRRFVPSSIQEGDQVFMYSSSPQKALVGKFIIDKIVKEKIENLWNMYGQKGGISYEDFKSYFVDTSFGFCLILKEISFFPSSIKLEDLQAQISNFTVPQSYRYLKPDEIEILNQKILIAKS